MESVNSKTCFSGLTSQDLEGVDPHKELKFFGNFAGVVKAVTIDAPTSILKATVTTPLLSVPVFIRSLTDPGRACKAITRTFHSLRSAGNEHFRDAARDAAQKARQAQRNNQHDKARELLNSSIVDAESLATEARLMKQDILSQTDETLNTSKANDEGNNTPEPGRNIVCHIHCYSNSAPVFNQYAVTEWEKICRTPTV